VFISVYLAPTACQEIFIAGVLSTRATAFLSGQEFQQVIMIPRGVETLAFNAPLSGFLPLQQV
jgi:hypothetical protein